MKLDSHKHPASLLEDGFSAAIELLSPERAFIAYRGRTPTSEELPEVYCTQGFSFAIYTEEDISTEVVRRTLRKGQSQLILDAVKTPGLNNRTSVVLSGLRSILTAPLRHSNGLCLGLLYLDNRVKVGAFKADHQEQLELLAQNIVDGLTLAEQSRHASKAKAQVEKPPLEDIKTHVLGLAAKGQYTEALGKIDQWMHGQKEGPELGIAHGVRSRVLQQMGQMNSAFESASISAFLLKKVSGDRLVEHQALMLNNLASLHIALDNSRRAEGLFLASMERYRKLTNESPRTLAGLAGAQYNLGRLYQEKESLDLAKPLFSNALTLLEKSLGADHPKAQKVRKTLESLDAQQG